MTSSTPSRARGLEAAPRHPHLHLALHRRPAALAKAREAIHSLNNSVSLSATSAWEIAVKHAAGRLILAEPPSRLIPRMRELHGIEALTLEEPAAREANHLPPLHRDPCDRMLVCQAIVHGLTIVTPDPLIQQYSVRTLW